MGGIGAHKFYAGKIDQVFLYIIFSITFIPGIIDLIEALMALGKQTDEYGNIIV
ncbi:TPA: NINE protein [Streptococcus agalactiae]|nr:NINE protein [Streptococcus agalactiae]